MKKSHKDRKKVERIQDVKKMNGRMGEWETERPQDCKTARLQDTLQDKTKVASDESPPRRGGGGFLHRAQGTGHRAQSTGHRAQSTGHRAQSTGYRGKERRAAYQFFVSSEFFIFNFIINSE